MIRNLNKWTKNASSAAANLKKASFYDHVDKHGNEVSIILVITDENLQVDEMLKNKRKKFHEANYYSKTESSENRDRSKYFNLICSQNESNILNLEDFEKIKKILFKNLHNNKIKKLKKDELNEENRHQRSKKTAKGHNIYGPVRYIPTSYSRPPLPPFYRDKLWAHTAKELRQSDADSNVLTKFLYSKYDFDHSTPNCSSESSDSERLRRDDSLELKPAYSYVALGDKVQVGDRPDKNLDVKKKYFRVNENDITMSSQSSSSCEFMEETCEDQTNLAFPISRQNRIIFYETSNEKKDKIKYEANLPKLLEQNSTLTIKKRFEFNSLSRNLGLKYNRKKEIGNGLKHLNQSEVKNLSVITEEENLSSSSSSLISENDKTNYEPNNDLDQNLDENSIQKDIELASESFSSTDSSIQNSDDQNLNDIYGQSQAFNIRNENFYRLVREKEDLSFKNLYNNYFSLIDKKFAMSFPRQEADNQENLFYI